MSLLTTIFQIVIFLHSITRIISSDLKRSCSTIPYEVSLPLQCTTIISNNTQDYYNSVLQHYVLRCDSQGNYPYLLHCHFKTGIGFAINETCIHEYAAIDSITCCNQVIKDWNYTIQNDPSWGKTTQNCPLHYQLTSCDNQLTYGISTTNCTAQSRIDSSDLSYAHCHKLPSDQELICNTIDINGLELSSFPKTEACPNNEVMLWCDTGSVLYNATATGLCSVNYRIAYCCSLYQIEQYDATSKYIMMNYTLSNYSQVDTICMQQYGTHSASIHTQEEFMEAYELCQTEATVVYCCLGGNDEKRENVWLWNDGSGTFPPDLKWDEGGLWRYNQPQSREAEHYACIQSVKGNIGTDEGIRDCTQSFSNQDRCHPICAAPEAIARRRLFTEAYTKNGNELCFELEISMNVENILPDPGYILRQANIDVIQSALKLTLKEHQITGFNITSIIEDTNTLYSSSRRRMLVTNWSSVDDECPLADDTVEKFYFETIPYNMTCNESTLNLNQTYDSGTLECEFTTPQSAVYVWSVNTISSLLLHADCLDVRMQANITQTDGYRMGQSAVIEVHEDMSEIKQFLFNGSALLKQDTTYVVTITIFVAECSSKYGFAFLFNNTLPQVMIRTIAEPNSCELSSKLATNTAMIFGAGALCDANTSNATRELFEDVLYQSHSSDTFITSQEWRQLGTNRRRLGKGGGTPTPTKDDCGTQTCKNSLDLMFQDGTLTEIAGDEIFPCYGQCLAYDAATNRVYAVGGAQNGAAVDWLKVFELQSQESAIQLNDSNTNELKLDKPRVAAMCYHYVNQYDNNREYIMVINGANQSQDIIGNNDMWYRDIVFIPLDADESVDHLPQIQLKYNVIDMRPFVSESNELYLFGGRDGSNATQYIQVVDLNDVFNGSYTSSDVLTTMDRMQPMQTQQVLPFVDFLKIRFPNANNESCIMILGGQNYVNNEWIDIEVPVTGLQLYCNNVLNLHLQNRRRRLQNEYTSNFVEFTDFDTSNLINLNASFDEDFSIESENVVIVQYNFENDGIFYEFSETFQVCFDDNLQLLNAIDAIESDASGLNDNILEESKKDYRGWSYGFGDVNISNLNILIFNNTMNTTAAETMSTTEEEEQVIETITTNLDLPTKKPTAEDKLELSTVLWIVGAGLLAIIILVIVIYFIYKCIRNNNPYLRAPDNETDIDDETEDDNL